MTKYTIKPKTYDNFSISKLKVNVGTYYIANTKKT